MTGRSNGCGGHSCVCFFRSVPGPKRPSFIAFVTSGQATAAPIGTTKSGRFMGVFASGRKTPHHRANAARYCASQQFCPLDFRALALLGRRVGTPTWSWWYSSTCRAAGSRSCRRVALRVAPGSHSADEFVPFRYTPTRFGGNRQWPVVRALLPRRISTHGIADIGNYDRQISAEARQSRCFARFRRSVSNERFSTEGSTWRIVSAP